MDDRFINKIVADAISSAEKFYWHSIPDGMRCLECVPPAPCKECLGTRVPAIPLRELI